MSRRAILLGLFTALAAGCESSPSAVGGNCASAAAHLCVYVEAASNNLVTQATCIDVLGPDFTFVEGAACPTDLLVGRCALFAPDGIFLVQYYEPGFTQGDASADCASRGGAFQAQPGPVPVR